MSPCAETRQVQTLNMWCDQVLDCNQKPKVEAKCVPPAYLCATLYYLSLIYIIHYIIDIRWCVALMYICIIAGRLYNTIVGQLTRLQFACTAALSLYWGTIFHTYDKYNIQLHKERYKFELKKVYKFKLKKMTWRFLLKI